MSKVYKLDEDACDTLIISDLHLGSIVSRAGDVRRMLQSKTFQRLILLGDIFCDLDFRRLTKEHWELLSHIRKLSNPKRKVEVVWVEGNHDRGLSEVMSHLVGVKVYQEYQWTYAGRRYLAIHGHQYDSFLVGNAALSATGEWLYMHLQKLDSKSRLISRFLDRQNTKWMHLSPRVASGALAYAEQRGADVVFCGHTHAAMQAERKGVRYFNSGCWTTEDPTYITVDELGVQIHDYVSEQANRALDFEPASGAEVPVEQSSVILAVPQSMH
jgi:UDP-2,3-diacylglucosamine pyrophosphatase LpxH